MPIKFIKKPQFVDTAAAGPSATTHWISHGESNEQTVQLYTLTNTPRIVDTVYGELWRTDITLKQTAYNMFDVDVSYGPRKEEKGEWTFDFDTSGGTVHVTVAKSEIARYPVGQAPDQRGVIGVNGDEIAGADQVIPAMKLNVQYRHPKGEITIPQAKLLASITGTVNSTTFLTFAPGEVLFLGARGSDGTTAEASVGYQFACSPNASNLSFGGITGVAKEGWDVAWVKFEDAIDSPGGNDTSVKYPQFVYIDRIYDRVDFRSVLGFG
jgi:hypothetical protein